MCSIIYSTLYSPLSMYTCIIIEKWTDVDFCKRLLENMQRCRRRKARGTSLPSVTLQLVVPSIVSVGIKLYTNLCGKYQKQHT